MVIDCVRGCAHERAWQAMQKRVQERDWVPNSSQVPFSDFELVITYVKSEWGEPGRTCGPWKGTQHLSSLKGKEKKPQTCSDYGFYDIFVGFK